MTERSTTHSNKRSNLVGAVGAALPFIGAALGIAAIAGLTGCHMEVLAIPFGLIAAGAIAAVITGIAAVRMRRSKRGVVMPVIAILTGIGALVWLVTAVP